MNPIIKKNFNWDIWGIDNITLTKIIAKTNISTTRYGNKGQEKDS